MKQSRVIGITGGVGAGKSSVMNWLKAHYSLDIIAADAVGAELMEPGKAVYEALVNEYGQAILTDDGLIDKARLSAIAFRDDASQKRINAIEHPIIKAELEKRILASRYRTVLLEAALLKEGELIPLCDEVWVISADRETRISRLMTSRSYSRGKCETILNLQLSDDEFAKIADVVIDNGGAYEKTRAQLVRELKRLGVRKRKQVRS